MIFGLLYFLPSDKSDSLNYESDKLGSDSISSHTYSFHDFSLRFDNSIGSVGVLGYVIFVPTEVESKDDIFVFDVFVSTRVDPKGG